MNLLPGDLVEISATGDFGNAEVFRVKAVFQEKPDPYTVPLKRNAVKMHLSDLERVTGKSDQLDLISIRLKPGANGPHVAARLNEEAIGFTAVSADEMAVRTSTTFVVVNRFHEAIALITMFAGAIFIFALMVMRVEDQRKHLAILAVTGISRRTILLSLSLESTCFAFFATLLGAILGFFASGIVNAYYRNFYETTLVFSQVTPKILLQAMGISFFLGVIAGTFSWFRLRRLAMLEELGR